MTFSEVNKKRLKIVGYLIVSGLLAYTLSTYVLANESLTVILAPAINFVLYSITEELKGEGYIKASRTLD
jgi:hypothetical protein